MANYHHHDHDENDINDLGLQADVSMMTRKPIDRRRVLQLSAAGIVALLTGCSTATSGGGSNSGGSTTCVTEIPEETAGPYPADGSSGGPGDGNPGGTPPGPGTGDTPVSGMQTGDSAVNVLGVSGIVRSDIRTSIGTGNTAEGVPATINLQLVNINNNCEPLAGYAIYLWHCTEAGEYSLYSTNIIDEDYLRGVQATDADGLVSFTSIFPACYSGRWPHIHFEVYPSVDVATSADNKLNTSQLALPQAVCEAVYNSVAAYSASINNLAQLSLDTDNVFSDGYASQLASVTGSVTNGYTITLQVGIEA